MYDPSELYQSPVLKNLSVGFKNMPPKAGVKPLKVLKPGMGLYEARHLPDRAPDKSKPWAVVNLQTGDIRGRWHPDKASAEAQCRAMYASMGDKAKYQGSEEGGYMNEHFALAFAETAITEDDKDGLLWVEAMPAKTWHTGFYGDVEITEDKLHNFVKNFDAGVRGIEIQSDYDHGMDRSKGNRASGTFKSMAVKPREKDGLDTLYVGIEPTPVAVSELKNGEWKYFSLEWEDQWTSEDSGETYQDVVTGGGFTNKPLAKGLAPINFSEIFVEKKAFASTSSSDTDDTSGKTPKKPYGNVTYADPGYQSDGKKRYPLDTETHIRAAWSYINMPKNSSKYSSSQLASIKGKIRAAMSRIGATLSKQASEAVIEKYLNDNMMPAEEAERIMNEVAAEEHQEPGTGGGGIDYSINADDTEQGSRQPTPPPGNDDEHSNRGGVDMQFSEEQLTELKGLGPDEIVDRVKQFSEFSDELDSLRELKRSVDAKKKFAEEYPEEAAELELARKDREERAAKAFSEIYAGKRITKPNGRKEGDNILSDPTTLGFSGRVINELENVAKQFSEGKPKIESVSTLMDAVLDNGIVDYGDKGSSAVGEVKEIEPIPPAGSLDARKQFNELIKEVVEEHKDDDHFQFGDAVKEATKRNPELAEAYRKPPVAA